MPWEWNRGDRIGFAPEQHRPGLQQEKTGLRLLGRASGERLEALSIRSAAVERLDFHLPLAFAIAQLFAAHGDEAE